MTEEQLRVKERTDKETQGAESKQKGQKNKMHTRWTNKTKRQTKM